MRLIDRHKIAADVLLHLPPDPSVLENPIKLIKRLESPYLAIATTEAGGIH